MGRNMEDFWMLALPPIWSGLSFVLMIIRMAVAGDACVACQVSENREADSGSCGGFDVRTAWRMASRTFALAAAAPESTSTAPSPPTDMAMLPPAPAII